MGAKRSIGSVTYGVLFCAWIVSAIVGFTATVMSCAVLVDPAGVKMSDDADPFGPPPKRSTAAVHFSMGLVMIAWPLPFVLRDRRRPPPNGFGRWE